MEFKFTEKQKEIVERHDGNLELTFETNELRYKYVQNLIANDKVDYSDMQYVDNNTAYGTSDITEGGTDVANAHEARVNMGYEGEY